MAGITEVGATFAEFGQAVREARPDDVRLIERLANGFEGWLKLEFYLWLVRKKQLTAEDVGLEYRVALDQRRAGMDRETKLCDLWIRDDGFDDAFHYVELKCPFANKNSGKLLTSAGSDFWYLSRLRAGAERARSGNAIVFGVGFAEEDWGDALSRVRAAANLHEDTETTGSGSIGTAIRWGVFTHNYGS